MKTIFNKIVLIGSLIVVARVGNSQGFVNLDFESANLTGYPPGSMVPATDAFPGWTVDAQYVLYDNISLSGESISIMDSAPSIQGRYYALIEPGNTPGEGVPISLGQTGTVPLGTESITFWGNIGGLQITFDGQPLSFSEIGSTANYNIYGADISAFAGQTGQLLFSMPPYVSYATLDNIQFSTSPIPEPSEVGLFTLAALSLSLRRWRNSSR